MGLKLESKKDSNIVPAENISLALAFGAGILSFLSPCVLPLVPAYVGLLAGKSVGEEFPNRAKTLAHALAFVLGFSTVFVGIWVSIGLIGYVVQGYIGYIRQIGGIILIVMGLHLVGVIKIPFLYREVRFQTDPQPDGGLHSSFLIGVLFSAGWTPCIGTVLAGIIGLATFSDTVWQGAYLLIAYSAGLGIPFLATALAIGQATMVVRRLNRHARLVEGISGLFVIAVGLLMLTNMFLIIPQYFRWAAI